MEIVVNLWNILLFLFFLSYPFLLSNKRKKKALQPRSCKLPPGSMGWPCIGETHQLYSKDPSAFFASKLKRYGEIFKTHILGCPCVILATPEAIRFVLGTQSRFFKPTYPKSKMKLIGPSALFFHQGKYHAGLRKLVHSSLSPDSIRRLVPGIEFLAISALNSLASRQVVANTFHAMKKFAFDVGVLSVFGRLDGNYRDELTKHYSIVDKGYNSFPTSIPGTAYSKAVSARKRLSQIVGEIISRRRGQRLVETSLLDLLVNSRDGKGQSLTDDQIADNIIGVLFAAQDTTASVLTWVLMYLHDFPNLLESVKAEQTAIFESNGCGNRPLTWDQTRNMPLTSRVILECLRMASIISFTFREAVVDVEYEGYLIPKGWKVMPLFRNIHHNPEFFPDPQNFDPSRFEAPPKSNTFLPFGSGVHACPGNELAKLEILVLIHHLVTKFRWEVVGSQSGVEYGPFPIPQNGLPARFWRVES